jgi:hypothetical protein
MRAAAMAKQIKKRAKHEIVEEPELEIEREPDDDEIADKKAQKDALELLRSPMFFRWFLDDISRAGLVGERRNAEALYLVATSRLRNRPINAIVKGGSSSGKNYLVRKVMDFFPKDALKEISSMSAHALNFTSEEKLENTILYFFEIDGANRAAHPNRLLISEGKLVHWYSTTSKWGRHTTQEVTGGPVACISTTTENTLKMDDESRHLSLWIDQSPGQTKRIAKAYAAGNPKVLTPQKMAAWIHVQELLFKRKNVPINMPAWFEGVVELIPVYDVRIRRYWPAFVEACKTVSLLRSYQWTDKELEERGGLTVSFEDFAVANTILDKTVSDSLSRNAEDEELWVGEMVARIGEAKAPLGPGVEASDLLNEPGVTSLDKAYRLLRKAERAGTIFQSNLPGKNNGKFYIPTMDVGFIGNPEVVFRKIKPQKNVKFVHPIKGEWIEYGNKSK